MRTRTVNVCSLPEVKAVEIDKATKGDFLTLSINPYNGKVYMSLGKGRYTSQVAYRALCKLFDDLRTLERYGSDDPVSDLVLLCGADDETIEMFSEVARKEADERRRQRRKIAAVKGVNDKWRMAEIAG